MAMAMRNASRANTRSVTAPSSVGEARPVRHSSQVPNTCTMVWVGAKLRAVATSSTRASTSELRNSDERWQLLQTRWKCLRVPVGRLESRSAFAEIDLAGDAGADHPLKRPVDRGAADAWIFTANQVAEVIGAQMTFLTHENVQDAVALARALAAGRSQSGEIGK